LAETVKKTPNQKVGNAHFERFNWLSAKRKKKLLGGLPPIGQLKSAVETLHF